MRAGPSLAIPSLAERPTTSPSFEGVKARIAKSVRQLKHGAVGLALAAVLGNIGRKVSELYETEEWALAPRRHKDHGQRQESTTSGTTLCSIH
jgi:hypothetical protein